MKTNILSFLNTDIAKKFEANFRTQNTQNSFSEFIVSTGSTTDAVWRAFAWSLTPEGIEFWNTINNLWKKFLEEGGEPIPEDQDIDIEALTLKSRFDKCLEKFKLSPESVMDEFRSLFGEKVFEAFKSNVKYYPSVEDAVRSLIDNRSVFDLVDLSFCWLSTPEGHKYWKKISDVWKEYWEARTGMRCK